MQIRLSTRIRQVFFMAATLAVMTIYVRWAGMEFLADRFATQPTLADLQRAIRLQPRNAEYHYRLGRYYSLVLQSPQQALSFYQSATALNPHQAAYWFSLAGAYQLLGMQHEQEAALESATQTDPTTPDVAWEAANLYLVRGQDQRALAEFRVVLENDPYRVSEALRLCWQIKPDLDYLLQHVLPPNPQVYFALLEYLVSRNEDALAAGVWAKMTQLNQPLEANRVFEYIRYLLAHEDVRQARLVWQQSANLCGLAAYQPSPENLVINGNFSLDILNAGFDWRYDAIPGVALALDPSQPHLGPHSMSISYDSPGLNDSGLWQLVPVEPNTLYEFSAYFKALDMQGAGGPQIVVEDTYSGVSYLATENLKDADFWKQAGGTFTTGNNASLITVRLRRIPAGSPIRGKLWMDGVRLSKKPEIYNSK